MTEREALNLALDALEAAYARLVTKCEQNLVTYNGVDVDTLTLSQEAITAIKEALAQPEPVAWEQFYPDIGKPKLAYLSPTESPDNACYIPPQRTWVGLTEDEAFACKGRDYFETYQAIEAKLKEKNT